MMASFFGKPKASSSTTSPSKGPAPSTSNTLSDFDRVFRPFVLKKDAELAPINWIRDVKRTKRHVDADVIVIDGDDTGDHDIEMITCEPSPNASTRGKISLSSPGWRPFTEMVNPRILTPRIVRMPTVTDWFLFFGYHSLINDSAFGS
jgi:chromatin assembly factor 1 subunit A